MVEQNLYQMGVKHFTLVPANYTSWPVIRDGEAILTLYDIM